MSERKLIVIFTVLTLVVSWAYEALIIARGGVQSFGLVALLILMWIPGLVSILMRLVLKLGFADVRFIVGKPRYYFYAVSIPLVLAIVTGLLAAIFDIRQLTPIRFDQLSPAVPIFAMMLCFGLAGALGEELGWRGFLLPKMIAGGISHPYLISGIIWACWHLPLIAFGGFYTTGNTVAVVLAYGLSIVSINFVISELRVRSGSVWVATVLHAAHNFFFQLAIPYILISKPGSRSDLWEIVGGDSGFIVALLYLLTFVLLYCRAAKPADTRISGPTK